MKKIVSTNMVDQAKTVAGMIAQLVQQKPDAVLCLAAGDTPTDTYQEMAHMQKEGAADFRNCRLIGLDEWVGVDETIEGGCKKYIQDHVIYPLQLHPENISFFNAMSDNLQEECAKADKYLEQNGPIDLSLMGVGMNGHIALNEPGCSFNDTAHVVSLNRITLGVAQKYFNEPMQMSQGITLGMHQILDSKFLIVMANGKKKQSIMHEAMYGAVSGNLPASALQIHQNCIVSLDAQADSDDLI